MARSGLPGGLSVRFDMLNVLYLQFRGRFRTPGSLRKRSRLGALLRGRVVGGGGGGGAGAADRKALVPRAVGAVRQRACCRDGPAAACVALAGWV